MDFNKHYDLKDKHAFLSPSKYHWINYDGDRLMQAYMAREATERGTELHKLACDCIRLGVNLPRSKKTLNMYVNDAIGYRMTPEQILCYSPNCFGTADAIAFRNKLLRIHDYKSGETPASMHQLEVYAAIFCLEYHFKPTEFATELRIYQNNDILIANPPPELIQEIMEKIVIFDQQINKLRMGV